MTELPKTEWIDPPVLAREADELPDALPRGAEIPEDLDPLADGVLMAHQAQWLEDESDLKVCAKGRRTGITFAEALDDTLIAAAKRSAGGQNVFYIGDTKGQGPRVHRLRGALRQDRRQGDAQDRGQCLH